MNTINFFTVSGVPKIQFGSAAAISITENVTVIPDASLNQVLILQDGRIIFTIDAANTLQVEGSTISGTLGQKSDLIAGVLKVGGAASLTSTDALSEGSTNKYWTNARTIASVLTGYTKSLTNRAIAATDTLLTVLGILEKKVDDLVLTVTPVKTSAYTAAAGDFIPVDTTSGGVTITLPTAPADKTIIAFKHVIQGGTNTVSVTRGGTDVFNKAGGSTSLTLTLVNEALVVQYQSSTGIWIVRSNDVPLSGLDSRYPLLTTSNVFTSAQTIPTLSFSSASGATTGYLTSTTNAVKGKYGLNAAGTIVVDEANVRVGIGNASPAYKLDVSGTGNFTGAVTTGPNTTVNGYMYTANFSGYGFGAHGFITDGGNGILRLEDVGQTSFGRLQFGGSTSSYPSIKRNGANLDFRTADDAAYTGTQSLYDRFGTGSPEGAVTAPIGAFYHRTDGGANTTMYVKESGTGNTGWIAK